jgi:hypothetical protein
MEFSHEDTETASLHGLLNSTIDYNLNSVIGLKIL